MELVMVVGVLSRLARHLVSFAVAAEATTVAEQNLVIHRPGAPAAPAAWAVPAASRETGSQPAAVAGLAGFAARVLAVELLLVVPAGPLPKGALVLQLVPDRLGHHTR